MDANTINSSGNAEVQASAAIYAQKKGQEAQQNQVMEVMQSLDENTKKQAMQDVAAVTGKGYSLNIQG
jgi:hypothetical protein